MGVHDLAIPKIVQFQLAEQVSERVRELIFECRLLPGARLVERDLAELLGVSRTPIREALFQLRQEGLVTASQGRGLFVSGLDESEIVELYQTIAALERAALLHTKSLSAAMLADLAAARERLSASHLDPARAIAADGDWHEALTRGCRNTKLLQLLGPLRALSRRYERAFFRETANLKHSIREHQAIEIASPQRRSRAGGRGDRGALARQCPCDARGRRPGPGQSWVGRASRSDLNGSQSGCSVAPARWISRRAGMGVSIVDGTLELAELKKVRQNLRVYSLLVFRQRDGSAKTVEKAVVDGKVAARLEPGVSGRFYLYQAIDHRGVHGVRDESGGTVFGYSKLNERAMLVTALVGLVIGFLYVAVLDKFSLWSPILLILGAGGYFVYRGTRLEAERQFSADNPGAAL